MLRSKVRMIANQVIEKARVAEFIESVGKDSHKSKISKSQSESLASKIQSKERRWKVLEDDSEDEDGNVKVHELE